MRLKINARILVTSIILMARMTAQTPADSAQAGMTSVPGLAALPPRVGVIGMRVDSMDAAPVKGAPFCATITTEHTQTFADGNRIHTTDDSTLCRDSAGRTRREASLNLLGVAPQKSATKLITIVDPVAGFRYLLDAHDKTAHRLAISSAGAVAGGGNEAGQSGLPANGEHAILYPGAGTAGRNVFFNKTSIIGHSPEEPAPTTEHLGDQKIDGIHATGIRVTTTIPSGSMGNEQAIVVTSERWYSPELKATVMTKHSDPWAGELKTHVTKVNTLEPDVSLFIVPADYRVVDEKGGPVMVELPSPAPPPQ